MLFLTPFDVPSLFMVDALPFVQNTTARNQFLSRHSDAIRMHALAQPQDNAWDNDDCMVFETVNSVLWPWLMFSPGAYGCFQKKV